MTKLTPEQLQEAKKQARLQREAEATRQAEQRIEAERRNAEEQRRKKEEEELAKREWAEQRERLKKALDGYRQVHSQASAFHKEIGKFAIKWPGGPAPTLGIDRTNRVVRETRELLKGEGDVFVPDINELIEAGESVPYQDVFLTLTDALAALERFKLKYWKQWRDLLGETP